MSKALRSLTLLASLVCLPLSIAQQPFPALPTYDIAVIKPNNSLSHHMSLDIDQDSLLAENVSLKVLLVTTRLV
jgi:hypothetical protein